ncbi:MAG: LPP20 family lipoprotein [Bacteroidales bacterium]|nr:LPP20 family lipoprotein [Bacteroidales bacterium]
MKKLHLLKVLSLAFVSLTFLLIAGCHSSKEIVQAPTPQQPKEAYEEEVVIKQYCSGPEFTSTDGFIRASGVGESADMVISKKVARSNTLEELGSKIKVTVKSVIDNYNKRTQKNVDETIEKRYENLTRSVIDQTISGYRTICEKVTKTNGGKYRTYLAFEIPEDSILNPLFKKIAKDDELKIDYDYEKFRRVFNEEMKKNENQ